MPLYPVIPKAASLMLRRGALAGIALLLVFSAMYYADAQVADAHVANAQMKVAGIAPNRYLVVYRNAAIPADVESHLRSASSRLVRRNERFGIASVQSDPGQSDASAMRRLAAQPDVDYVLHDRIVSAQRLQLSQLPLPTFSVVIGSPSQPYDAFYASTVQAWAVQQVGGYGNNVPGGPAHGPWDVTMGKGVRIAILDSGVDASHPDIAPNLALNLSEVDQTAYPSPCDDGSPQDQAGHGTWTASLAAAALGPGTGLTVGVAPEATILNIKVLQRMPGVSADGTDSTASQCVNGQASGLLSWVMQGIEDAIANHADVISLSVGAMPTSPPSKERDLRPPSTASPTLLSRPTPSLWPRRATTASTSPTPAMSSFPRRAATCSPLSPPPTQPVLRTLRSEPPACQPLPLLPTTATTERRSTPWPLRAEVIPKAAIST